MFNNAEDTNMNITSTLAGLLPLAVAALMKIVLAVALWFVGQWLISMAVGLITRGLRQRQVDTTLTQYVATGVSVLLKVILIVSLLGYFGIQTTTFAALFAAIGFAIGAAWSGSLANLAAGAFLIFLRPFKVGDFISAGDMIGTVREIGIFVTAIDTMDNVRTFIGNNKIFSGTIQNFSTNPYRRVDLQAQLNHEVDHRDAINRLRERLLQIPNVLASPAPDLEILTFNLAGLVLAVRPYCHNDFYWQVYFDTNRTIRETFGDAKYLAPETHYVIRNSAGVTALKAVPQQAGL